MLWRSSRGRPRNTPPAFIRPCRPTVAKRPPTNPGWAHELKHDGYRLQIHVRDGRVRLALDERLPPQVVTVPHEEVEGTGDRATIGGATVQGVELRASTR